MKARILGVTYVIFAACSALASQDSIGPNGINSAALNLNGSGVPIGQVDQERPGIPGFDSSGLTHNDVVPSAVFFLNVPFPPTPKDAGIDPSDSHALEVAGIMISNHATATGVAPSASLYASATTTAPTEEVLLSMQHIALQAGGDVRAINMSFGEGNPVTDELNGNSQFTLFMDWSARQHDVLYVKAGAETGPTGNLGDDNYNGMTIASSSKVNGVGAFRQVSSFNLQPTVDQGDRTFVSLIAPGENIQVPIFNNAVATRTGGTSFAAPHVTGTVALLQQHANTQIGPPAAPRWDVDARRHQVMKAVLMNSADKFIDNGTVTVPGELDPLPPGSLLGMERTVIDEAGANWFASEAYGDEPFSGPDALPLDDEMGAGHLNAKRAFQQYQPGEYDSDGAAVPVIGWDYATTSGAFDTNRYSIGPQLFGGSFISVTMAWDRVVNFSLDQGTQNFYDIIGEDADQFAPWTGDPFPPADDQINDLDLYLVPSGMGPDDAIAQSFSNDSTIEHLFFQIPATGNYDLIVEQFDAEAGAGGQIYAIAWWAAPVPSIIPGDYDGNGTIGPEDYNIWRENFGEPIAAGTGADGNRDGSINAADYVVWRKSFDAAGSGGSPVPEPSAALILATLATSICIARRPTRLCC